VPSDPLTSLDPADRVRLEAMLVEFDLGWTPDRLAAAVGELPAGGALRAAGLRELVKIDRERKARAGQPVALEAYFDRFPELREAGTLLDDLPESESVSGDPTPAPRDRPGPPRLPDPFGRYRIVRPLGRGGMGSVYLAHDTELDRKVALKVPHFRLDDVGAMERFAREARAAATIDHPNVCRVYDVGRVGDVPYLTMVYVEGPTLADELKAGPMPARRAAGLARDVARALADAHRRGVVHRDLKPGNILLDPDGRPVVADFGLARRAMEALTLTEPGEVLGTPLYMPPEQLTGDAEQVGPASDVYALGAVLYECLTGRPPFAGSRSDVVTRALTQPPPPPGIDSRLDGIVLKALAKRPADRFGMAAFADALAEWLDRAPQPRRTLARWLIGTGMVAIVLGLLLPAAVKLGWLEGPKTNRATGPPATPKALASGTTKQDIVAVGFSPDGRLVYVASTDRAFVRVGRFDAVTGQDESVKMRPFLSKWFVFAADGRRFLADAGHYARLYRMETGEDVQKFETGANASAGAISRDGSRVIAGRFALPGFRAWVWDCETGRSMGIFAGHGQEVRTMALSDDGRWAFSASPDRYALWEVEGARPTGEAGDFVRSAAFLPNSPHVLVGTVTGGILELRPASKAPARRFADGHTDTVAALATSADGRHVVSGGFDRTVRVWDAAAGRERWQLPGVTGRVTGVAVSPDGRRVAAGADDRTWQVWELPEEIPPGK
jgi:hypothetical protein